MTTEVVEQQDYKKQESRIIRSALWAMVQRDLLIQGGQHLGVRLPCRDASVCIDSDLWLYSADTERGTGVFPISDVCRHGWYVYGDHGHPRDGSADDDGFLQSA